MRVLCLLMTLLVVVACAPDPPLGLTAVTVEVTREVTRVAPPPTSPPAPIAVMPPTPVVYPHETEIIAQLQVAISREVQSSRGDQWAQTLRKYRDDLSLSVANATIQFFVADSVTSQEDLELLAAETLVIGSEYARRYADVLAIEFWRYDDQHGLSDSFYLIGRHS